MLILNFHFFSFNPSIYSKNADRKLALRGKAEAIQGEIPRIASQ